MDEGNDYEEAFTYMVMPEEDEPLVGNESVTVVPTEPNEFKSNGYEQSGGRVE